MRLLAVALIISSQLALAEPIRFLQVTPSLFRSGQAETEADFESYRQAGIQTIIDLRQGKAADAEREQALRLGFRYINIPLNIASTPRDYLMAERKFFAVVDDASNGRVVFHCRHGKDRTGLMAALYRVKREGWSEDRAIAEWKQHGGFAEDWGNGIQDYFHARMRMTTPATCTELF